MFVRHGISLLILQALVPPDETINVHYGSDFKLGNTNTKMQHQSPSGLRLRLGVCMWLRGSWARRFPRQGRAAPAGQARGAAAGGDITAVTAASGGVGGRSRHHKARGAPTLQGSNYNDMMMTNI